MWKENASFKSFSPDDFMNSISEMTKNDQVQFSLNEAGDAKDFIIFILEQLHKELKKPVNNSNNINNNVLNQYDKQNAFNFFFNQFKKCVSHIDIISQNNNIENDKKCKVYYYNINF